MVERRGAQTDEHLARPGLGLGGVLVAENLGPAVLVDADRLHAGRMSHMQAVRLQELAEELGLDVVGAAPASPTRRPSGTSASGGRAACSPTCASRWPGRRSRAIPRRCWTARARSSRRRSATSAPARSRRRGRGACRATRGATRYAQLRERLDELGRRLGGDYRVLVDANQHVDREAAARSGVGFYGKNTMLITRRYGSWVVLGTLVTDVELEPTPPLDADCGSCTLCIDACPTGALDEPGVLDATRCLSYWTQAAERDPGGVPRAARRPGLRLRHLPGRLPLEPRDREAPRRARAAAGRRAARLARRLARGVRRRAAERYDRLFVPRNDPRYLRRNALVALGNSGGDPELGRGRYAEGDDPLLREHAEWALARAGGAHDRAAAAARDRALDRLDPPRRRPVRRLPGRGRRPTTRRATSAGPGSTTAVLRGRRARLLLARAPDWSRSGQLALGFCALAFDFADRLRVRPRLQLRAGHAGPRRSSSSPSSRRRCAAGSWAPSCCALASAPVAGRVRAGCGERDSAPHGFHVNYVTLQVGIELLMALIVGWLVMRMRAQSDVAEARAAEAERLRDELGRRADVLEAAEPLRPRARLVARARRGVRRVHPRAARPRSRSTASRSCSPTTATRT